MRTGKQMSLFHNDVSSEKKITEHYSSDSDVVLYHGDRLELINEIAIQGDRPTLIITSPPYNIGKEYEDNHDFDNYLEQQRATIEACVEILADNGSICWQVGHYIEGSGLNKEAFPLDLVLYPIFKSYGLKLKNRIVWTFGHGLHEKYRFSGRHETILWFVKSDDYIFNLDPIRVPQKYPGKRSFRGQNKGKPSGNPKGKNPSDIWDMPNVKANHIEKTEHPCQFPLGLVERFILGMTNPGNLVFDPYLGSGTTVAAAVKCDRRGAGSDTELEYLKIARNRVNQTLLGTLPYREMNKPIYTPDPNTSVASIPEEWMDSEE
jgi:adenine-specific DNA-methyltransferase